jgi:hypothetical protein
VNADLAATGLVGAFPALLLFTFAWGHHLAAKLADRL